MGNKVHTALLELGAQPVVNVGEGDDDEDIEADFDGWKADLFACLDDSFLVSKSQVRGSFHAALAPPMYAALL